ncbi:MAG: phosphate acyltransferase PlsX [Chloroflexota bacterium]
MRIVVDAMGSDNYPEPDVEGAVLAARTLADVGIVLVGDETAVHAELDKHDISNLDIDVVHASQVIAMDDKPSKVIREKKESSMHVGLTLVKEGQADAFVTMGNTGAVLAIATLRTLRRIPGVLRPALSLIFPTTTLPVLIDAGANVDNKPEHLYQFAVMGSLYMEKIRKIENPKVALISNGEEESKGTALINETGPLLADSHLNYVGRIEPKEFMRGEVDVGVTDGFTGNIIMKTSEAIAKEMSDLIRESLMSNPLTILGGLLARSAFTKVRQQLNPDEIGGIPLLGVNGALIVGHGRSNARAVETAVYQAHELVQNKVVEAIAEGLAGEQ